MAMLATNALRWMTAIVAAGPAPSQEDRDREEATSERPATEPDDPGAPRALAGSDNDGPGAPRRAPTAHVGADATASSQGNRDTVESADPSGEDQAAPRRADDRAAAPGGSEADLGRPRAVSSGATEVSCSDHGTDDSIPGGSMYARRVEDSPFRRTGVALGVALGASGCSGNADWCRGTNYFSFNVPNLAGDPVGIASKESRPGPSVIVEAGYRPIRLVEAVAFVQSSFRPQQVNVPQGSTVGRVNAFSVAGGVAAYVRPLAYSRFDPFVGLGIGAAYHRAHVEFESAEGIERTWTEKTTRALVRASVGLNIFVIERLSLGPRFDYDFFAGGRMCTRMERTDPMAPTVSQDECQSARELNDLDEVGGFKGPAGQLPQFWRVSLDVRTYF